MIEIETAKTGQPVLKKNGRLLSSAFQPAQEACAWADRQLKDAKPDELILVLGIGSGHHVAELLGRRPEGSVTVVECDAELARRAREIRPEIAAAAVYLRSPAAAYVTGHVMVVDGGLCIATPSLMG